MPPHTHQDRSQSPSATARKVNARGLGLTLAILGPLTALLIWGKLRFVSEMPRTAYATPKAIDAGPTETNPTETNPGDAGTPAPPASEPRATPEDNAPDGTDAGGASE